MAGVETDLTPPEILAALEDAVIAVDPAGHVVYANPAAASLMRVGTGVEGEATWQEVLRQNPWLTNAMGAAMSAPRSLVRHQMTLWLRSDRRTVSARIVPLFDGDGATKGAVISLSDASSFAALSEAVRREDRLVELGTLAAGLAHEIKNPLGGILGAAQLLRVERISKEAGECVDVIERDVRRINRLLEELLHFGNPRRLALAPLNLHRVIDEVLASLHHDPTAQGKSLLRDFDPSLPEVRADRDAMHQVLLNLLKNAFEASPAGEPVIVRTRADFSGRRVAGLAAVVEIQNAGEIAASVREHLFTPFVTTKATGSGLGLPISLRLMREQGGSLDVWSDRGCTISVVAIPLKTEPPESL